MRICWYWPHPHRTASPLVPFLLRADDELTVLALPSLRGETFGPVDGYHVVRTLPDPTGPSRFARVARKPEIAIRRAVARRRMLGQGFDLAHLQLLVYHTDWLDVPSLAHRTTLVSTVHDVRPHRRQVPRSVEDRLLGTLYRGAGDLIVYHESLRDELESDFGVETDRIHVVPIPIDSADRRVVTTSPPDGPPVMLFFGSFRPNKGLDVLLDAIEMLGGDVNCRFVVAGTGDDELIRDVTQRSERSKLLECEIGHVSDERKHELFSMASVVVMPYTRFHSMSGVLGDAYSYRVPVVATDVGALGPSVREHGTGIVVPPGSAEDLAAGLERMLATDRSEYREQLESAARRHDYSVVGPMIRQVYDVAAGRRGR